MLDVWIMFLEEQLFFEVYEEICSYCNIIDNEVEVKFFLVDKGLSLLN